MNDNEITDQPEPGRLPTSGRLPYGLARLRFDQPPAAVPHFSIAADGLVTQHVELQRVREQHTDAHDDWDQGGYCNTLVRDENGDGVVCGYRQGSPPSPAPEIAVKVDSRIPGGIVISEWGGARSSIRVPRELLGDLLEAIQVAQGVEVRGGVLAMVLEEQAPIEAPCVLTTGNDMEAYASAFNDGYETAAAQGLADDPGLAGDWLEEQLERARRAVRDVHERDLQESEHRFDPIGEADVAVCALCGLDPEATPHQHFEILYKAIDGVRAVAPGDQPDVMYDEKVLEGYQLALADVNAVLDHYFGPVKS